MLLRNAISKAKKLIQKIHNTTQSFKNMLSGGYHKLPKPSSINPFSCTESRLHGSFREFDQIYLPWETEQQQNNKMKEPIRENRPITNQDLGNGSFMKFGLATRQEQQRRRKKIVNEEGEVEGSRYRFEQKLKELEMMDMTNVEHVLDIEEVLHYYSRLTCPFYVDIVNKFFMEMYSEFLPQSSGREGTHSLLHNW